MMSRHFGQGRSSAVFTAVCVCAGAMSPAPATAGSHCAKYDVVQGYIIQGSSAPAAQTNAAASPASPQSQGLTAATPQAASPQLTAAPQLQVAPAPPVALQAAPVTYVPMVQLSAAPAPVQLATAPAPVQLATAPAPVQMVSLATTTPVHYVTLQAAPIQMVSLAVQPQVAVQVATPVQILIPRQHHCLFFGK